MSSAKRPTGPFTPVDFQLVLLRRMADHNPDLVENARHELGSRSPTCARRTGAGRRCCTPPAPAPPPPVTVPSSVNPSRHRPAGSATWTPGGALARPALAGSALRDPGGAERVVWNEWLVRAPDAPGPKLKTLEDLTPWSCTVDEVARAFAPARPLEGTAPPAGVWPSPRRTPPVSGATWPRSSPGAVAADGRQRAAVRTASTTVGSDPACRSRNRLGSTSSSSITHGPPSAPSTRSTRA